MVVVSIEVSKYIVITMIFERTPRKFFNTFYNRRSTVYFFQIGSKGLCFSEKLNPKAHRYWSSLFVAV